MKARIKVTARPYSVSKHDKVQRYYFTEKSTFGVGKDTRMEGRCVEGGLNCIASKKKSKQKTTQQNRPINKNGRR